MLLVVVVVNPLVLAKFKHFHESLIVPELLQGPKLILKRQEVFELLQLFFVRKNPPGCMSGTVSQHQVVERADIM